MFGRPRPTEPGAAKVAGYRGFYLTAALSLLVSVDTSWRFFEEVLGITDWRERVVMFAVLEVALLSCGYGMRANVQRHGAPGIPRFFAWALCAVAAYMALQVSGPSAGLARVLLGPVLGLVMLHLALGIEIRAREQRSGTWARVVAEFRERLLSRVGLGNDSRDAATRTRDRAARRAARLALAKWAPLRDARLARALRTAGVAQDVNLRDRMLAELATLRHASELRNLEQPSPWVPDAVSAPATPELSIEPPTVTKLLPDPRGDSPRPTPTRRPPVTARPRSNETDEELIEKVRTLIAETGEELGKREVMRRLGIGNDRALRVLRVIKETTTDESEVG